MSELVELSYAEHGKMNVVEDCVMEIARKQHLINLRVTEVAQAGCCNPVFITNIKDSTDWAISALTGFQLNKNLLMKDGKWDVPYMPVSMQTYPFYLLKPESSNEGNYEIGIDPESDAFSETEGVSLFDERGRPSLFVNNTKTVLEQNLTNDLQTFQFLKDLNELELIKAVDLLIHHAGDTINTLTGLHTIDEDKLRTLSTEKFEELRNKGYLAPIYGILISIYQLNQLIKRHNALHPDETVSEIKVQIKRDL